MSLFFRTEDPIERSKRLKEEYATVITRIEETVRNGSKNRDAEQDLSNKNVRHVSLEEKLRVLSNQSAPVKAEIRQNHNKDSPKKRDRARSSKEPDIYEEYDRNFGTPDKRSTTEFLQPPISPDERGIKLNITEDERKVPKSTREWGDLGKSEREWDQDKTDRDRDQGTSQREWDQGKNRREWDQGKAERDWDQRKAEREWDQGKLHEPKNAKEFKNDYNHDDNGKYNSNRDKKSFDKFDKKSFDKFDGDEMESKKGKDYDFDDEFDQGEHKRRKAKKAKKHRRRSRSSSSEDRSKKSASHRHKKLDEKSEHICLEEWTPDRPSYKNDPTMESLKIKLKQKEDREEEERKKLQQQAEEEEERNRKLKESQVAEIPPPPPPPEPPLRNPVAIQWGAAARSKATPDRSLPTKKNLTAFVGKMPGRGLKKITPDKESSPAPALVCQPLLVNPPPLVSKPVEPVRPLDSVPPTTASIDMTKILEAAQAHIKNRNNKEDEIEIPLPPLPAAQVFNFFCNGSHAIPL